ncbi:MAG: RDD family protein, partial [Campylobacterota bacterium]|nr:RDD family protein [Campylobacterota bacterium]
MNDEIEEMLYREHIELADIKKRSIAFFVDELLLSLLLMVVLWDSFVQAGTVEQIIAVTNTFVLEYMAMKIF